MLFSDSAFFLCSLSVVPKQISFVDDLIVANPFEHERKWDDLECENNVGTMPDFQ